MAYVIMCKFVSSDLLFILLYPPLIARPPSATTTKPPSFPRKNDKLDGTCRVISTKLGYNSLRPWKRSLGVCANDRTIKQKQIIKKKVVGKKDRREKKSNGPLFPLMIGICAAALGGAGRPAYFFKFWFHFSFGNLCRLYFSSLLGWQF
jgi:hypothetical protein